jgi:hypothetical protein
MVMDRRRWFRLGTLVVASCALLLGAAPQLASASARGVGRHAAQPADGTGTVTGSVTITGAPKRFAPGFVGVGACPDAGGSDQMCANPQYTMGLGTSCHSLPGRGWSPASTC